MANNTAVDLQYSASIMITGTVDPRTIDTLSHSSKNLLNDLGRGAYEYMQHLQFESPGVTCESRIACYRSGREITPARNVTNTPRWWGRTTP